VAGALVFPSPLDESGREELMLLAITPVLIFL